MTVPFSPAHLEQLGFAGFVPLHSVGHSDPLIPHRSGVYAVVIGEADASAFLMRSVGGHFKGIDPTVPVELLDRRLVAGADTLYLGKANSLRRRVGEYADFGRGKPVGHRGGRLIWQMRDHGKLLVAWMPHEDAVAVEANLVAAFVAAYGTLPFANLVQPGLRAAA